MDVKIASAIRKEFRVRLASVLPEFGPARGERVDPQCDLYKWDPRPSLTCYLYLRPDATENCFTLDVACSPNHQFPESMTNDFALCDGVRRLSLAKLQHGDLLESRAAYWLRPPTVQPGAYDGGASLVAILAGRVDECIQDILEYALPFFRRCMDSHLEALPLRTPYAELDEVPYTVFRD